MPPPFAAVPAAVSAGTALLCAAILLYSGSTEPQEPEVGQLPPALARNHARPKNPAPGHPRVSPVQITLPDLGAAPIRAEDVRPGGQLNLPDDVHSVGWWSGGALLDSAVGSVVLAGHVDSARQGFGFFAALRRLRLDDRVTLRGTDGRSRDFRVTARRSYAKSGLPAAVFAQDVSPRLVLITCTGTFDTETHRYSDNLVVYAVPVAK